ncbi:TetR/AcrR family transcriptional regulator [Microbacterium sp. RD1]|uniref:TetR/AcrR family transcriptional regulator n=1 Tax=Microbacterium sp. RD1 TaxID=3457313 RepID=UPI003FA5E8D7
MSRSTAKKGQTPMVGQNQPERRAATRDALYDAAVALFAERGYENTTMADIAERARTSRRTAFNHFPRKSDIPMLWVRRLADAALLEADPAMIDTTERVRDYFRRISRRAEADPEVSRQMMLGWISAAGPVVYELEPVVDLVRLLSSGQGEGQIARDVDVAVAAETLSDALMGSTLRWVRLAGEPVSLEEMVDAAVRLVLRGMQAR